MEGRTLALIFSVTLGATCMLGPLLLGVELIKRWRILAFVQRHGRGLFVVLTLLSGANAIMAGFNGSRFRWLLVLLNLAVTESFVARAVFFVSKTSQPSG